MDRFFRLVTIASRLAISLAALVMLTQCGGDDDDDNGGGGDTRKILEIHMLENVSPRPLPGASQAADAIRFFTPVNGSFYRGSMGSGVLDNPLEFVLEDTLGAPAAGAIVNFTLLEGDGTLGSAVDTTDVAGTVSTGYTFSGDFGHAMLRAMSPDADTAIVYIRANTLIPGATGQAQYVLFEDTVGRVIDFNGPAEADVTDPNQYLQYLEYLTDEHIVVLVLDSDSNSSAQLDEPVVGVILTTGYTQKTPEGIGLGSTYDQMIAAYGQPDSVGYDGTPPPTAIYFYRLLGLNIYTEPAAGMTASSPLSPGDRAAPTAAQAYGYRRPVMPMLSSAAQKD